MTTWLIEDMKRTADDHYRKDPGRPCGKKEVSPGDLIDARIDLALGNDITAPLAIQAFKEIGAKKVFNRDRVVLVPDHFAPAKDILSAEQCKVLRNFAKAHRLTHFFEIGEAGIEHALLPEKGLVLPGDVVIGADSHTCTYGALGAFSTGVGSTDLGSGHGHRKALVQGSGEPEAHLSWKAESLGFRKGPDPFHHRRDRRGWGPLSGHGILRRGDPMPFPWQSRFTMANMAIEAGGKNGIFEPDEITLQYVKTEGQKTLSALPE